MDTETKELIAELANQLGVTVEYLWGALLKQAALSASVKLALIIFFFSSALAWSRRLPRLWREAVDEQDPVSQIMELIFMLAYIFFGALAVSFSLEPAITGFLNPEYWALDRIFP